MITGVIGGEIGSDPFDRKSWSGISYFFYNEMKKQGLLNRAFGTELPKLQKYLLMAKNFKPERSLWRRLYYMDPAYRTALTAAIKSKISPEDMSGSFLQFGAYFNLPSILHGNAPCYSYHDGNAAQSIKSPAFPKNIPAKLMDRTLAYECEVYHGLTMIFPMSEYLRQSFIHDFDMPEDRVVNIGGGINLDAIPEEIQDKDYSTQHVLFIGVEFERKGGRNLLQAWQRVAEKLPNARLHIVGPRSLEISPKLPSGVPRLPEQTGSCRQREAGRTIQEVLPVRHAFPL